MVEPSQCKQEHLGTFQLENPSRNPAEVYLHVSAGLGWYIAPTVAATKSLRVLHNAGYDPNVVDVVVVVTQSPASLHTRRTTKKKEK